MPVVCGVDRHGVQENAELLCPAELQTIMHVAPMARPAGKGGIDVNGGENL